jgi:hypothetical protein
MTCLLWSLMLVVCLIASVAALKIFLEALSKLKMLKGNGLTYFRAHSIRYTAFAILRAIFIGFFMMAFVSMFQFSYLKSPGPVAVAGIVFLIMIFGIGTAAGLACYRKVHGGNYICEGDTLNIERTRLWKVVPWFSISRQSAVSRSEDKAYIGSIPWWVIRPSSDEKSIRQDEKFITSSCWLASRYRQRRWWFFAVWLVYEFIRACFLAGASSQPLVQVFGLLAVESISFVVIIMYLRPFEGQRLNILLVYLLGFSKVATTALSAAFDKRFNLPRILTTVIGVVIIVIQGLLILIVLLTILLGATTTYFSIMRNHDEIQPRRWIPLHERYPKRLDPQVTDTVARPRSFSVAPMRKARKGTYFSVNQVQRVPKVEDEDYEFVQDIYSNRSTSKISVTRNDEAATNEPTSQRSRAASNSSQVSYMTLPRAARLHRPTWKSQEFAGTQSIGRARTLSNTMSSAPAHPDSAMNISPPGPKISSSSSESVCRRPSPLGMATSRSSTPAYQPIPHPFASHERTSLVPQPDRRPGVRSRSSSKLPLEETITKEDVPPMPQKSSNTLPNETEQA